MRLRLSLPLRFTITVLLSLLLVGCAATSHPEQPSDIGRVISLATMESLLAQPASVEVETFNSADWQVDLSGLLNLDSAPAKAARLKDRAEPIQVKLHAIRHPKQGLFLVDTGFAAHMVNQPETLGVGRLMRYLMKFDSLAFHVGPADVIRQSSTSLQGVFLTHLHFDHIAGLSDIDPSIPIYVGPGETTGSHWTHLLTRSVTDSLLAGRPALKAWRFAPNPDAPSRLAVVDVFQDSTVFAIQVPGHTTGSTAYLVRTPSGPVLLTGDTSHTRWGWEHDVEPGKFTADQAQNRASLLALKALVQRHPNIDVRLGHQP